MVIRGYLVIGKLNSGASSVEKYKVYKNGKYYLLRLFDARFMNGRYRALQNMEILYKNDISVPKVYEKGILNNKNGYAILDWIEGISVEQVLTNPELETQYGKLVSNELLKIHDIIVEEKVKVYDKYIESFSKKINKIINLEIEPMYIKLIRDYVEENIIILKQLSRNCIIHGDFHPGNIIINNNKIVFIDLDVCKISHPWEDLTSNACNMEFPNFYSSVITNYFNRDIPKEFWKVYNLYGCLYTLDYILYTLRIDTKTLENGKETMKTFLNFTDNFQRDVPKWFNDELNIKKKLLK